jgi:hypothetical protein
VTLSGRSKIGLTIASLIGIGLYLVVFDYGINAGRIHHGVHVRDIDVGGLTRDEATARLTAAAADLEQQPVIFTREGFDCNFEPIETGWDPRPGDTAASAYRVGRGTSWFAALATRVKAWVAGATIDWNDTIDKNAVTDLIDRCEERAGGLGYEIRRWILRQRIHEAIKTWPRQPFNVPVIQTG